MMMHDSFRYFFIYVDVYLYKFRISDPMQGYFSQEPQEWFLQVRVSLQTFAIFTWSTKNTLVYQIESYFRENY